MATRFQVVPIERQGRVLKVAMANPSNIFAIDDIKFITGLEVKPVVCTESEIHAAIDRYFDSADSLKQVLEGIEEDVELVEDEEEPDANTLSEESQNAPVVKLVNSLLVDAVSRGASDIHIECYEKHMRVRYRAAGDDAAPRADEERHRLAPEDHVRARHRRAPGPSGRSHQAEGGSEEGRSACLHPAMHLR